MNAEAAAGHVLDLEITRHSSRCRVLSSIQVLSFVEYLLASMARPCFSLPAGLLLAIANTFLVVHIVKRLARQGTKSEESGKWIETESECAARVEKVQVSPFKGDEEVEVVLQAALLDAGISDTCSALQPASCALQRDK